MATQFLEKMYVRCPFDREQPRIPRDFLTAQIIEIDEIAGTAKVQCRDPFNFRAYYDSVPTDPFECALKLLSRVSIYEGSTVSYKKENYTVLSTTLEDGWYSYYIQNNLSNQTIKVREDQLVVPFTAGKVSPITQIRRYEFQNPVWYMGRSVVGRTMKILENSVYGFKELAGCKIYLLPHQMNTIMRCLQDNTCRYMLADEVGMGKTIEAASILKIYILHNSNKKILVAVPKPLLEQWKTELFIKFDIGTGVDKKNNTIKLIPVDKIKECSQEKWDYVIFDEVHKLIGDDESYRLCHDVSKAADNVLLLSATPVQQKEEQYLNLLRLILPNKYDDVSVEQFKEQVSKQKKITRTMYTVLADLEDLIEEMDRVRSSGEEYADDDDCESIFEDIIDSIEEAQQLISDEYVDSLLDKMGDTCSDEGMGVIQEIVIYICDNYQLENRILRNRRGLISSDMAKREVYPISYRLDPDLNTYEAATYEAIVDWVTGQHVSAEEFAKYYIPLLTAFFSSSWAFVEEMDGQMQKGLSISSDVRKAAAEWLREENSMMERMEDVLAEPYNYSSRIVSTVDFIDQETQGKKVVLFTNYSDTFEKYAEVLSNYFGSESVALFNKSMESDELELNVYRFQNDQDCHLLLCDESGGEGRNLQIADYVVHIDLPWDANAIEQRIGRLDRLGREVERSVISVVVYTEETLENELYKFWKDGLSVFTKSLSGLEIIMNEINENIIEAVTSDFRYGISEAINNVVKASQEMEKDVREEQLFDTASFLYGSMQQQLKVTLEKYHRNENKLFTSSMMGWATLAGFKGVPTKRETIIFDANSFSFGSAGKSLFIPPRWEDYINKKSNAFSRKVQTMYEARSGKRNEQSGRSLEGTFDRKTAIENDYLHFFAPGDEIFDSIVNNALRSAKGQSTAFMVDGGVNWRGFVFTLSIEPNVEILVENNIPFTAISRFKAYVSMDQIIVPVPDDGFADVPADKVISELEKITELPVSRLRDKLIHLGRREAQNDALGIKNRYSTSNLDWFIANHPREQWDVALNEAKKIAVEKTREKYSKSSSLRTAKKEVDRMMNAEIARSRYYETEPEELQKIKDTYLLIIEALSKSRISTESVAYVWMVNKDEI